MSKKSKARKPAKRKTRRPPRAPRGLQRAFYANEREAGRAEALRAEAAIKQAHKLAAQAVQPARLPSKIKVGKRFRQDKGDIAALARSIEERGGLLQPICIDPSDKLIDGDRRLLAWSRSKFAGQPIPVHVVDVDSIIAGEWDANAQRKDFTYSEAVAIKRAIEGKLSEMARKRRGQAGEGKGRSADQASLFVGKKRTSLEKAEQVVEAAERDPGRFGKLKDDMDRSGKVDSAFKRLKNIERTDALKAEPPGLPMQGPYRTMVIDFPWASEEDGDAPGRGYYPYPTMGLDAVCEYAREQIRPIMHPDGCAVWLLIPNFHIVRGWHVRVLKELGVTASTMLTWCKPELGRGKRLRGTSEHAILGIAGDVPIVDVQQGTWFTAPSPREQHSDKPAEMFGIVEKVTPATRYAYLFASRELPENWDGHGDRVGKVSPADAAAAAKELLDEAQAGRGNKKKRQRRVAVAPPTDVDVERHVAEEHGKQQREFPNGVRGHVVSMTIDWAGADGGPKSGTSVATCQCGWIHRVPRAAETHSEQSDAAIDAHWRGVSAASGDGIGPGDDGLAIPPELRRTSEAAA